MFWHKLVNSLWYKKHLLALVLLPLSYFYRLGIFLRRWLYNLKFCKTYRFNLPIVVVGNITTGGTGKTPLVIALANFLKQHGYRPGIVSRGYGGKAEHYPLWVNEKSEARFVGDEAILLYQHTQCPVVVAPKRVAAVDQLITKTPVDVILCDDGLQHYALSRDVEIALIDGARRFGNGFCLPAGPLREPITRLRNVDYLIANGEPKKNEYTMQLKPKKIYNLMNPELIYSPEKNTGVTIHAVAAIGNPERFFASLRELNFGVIEHRFPDHYHFTAQDLDFPEEQIVIMTEKDAVKCIKFARRNFWVLAITAEINDLFLEEFLQKLAQKKLSF